MSIRSRIRNMRKKVSNCIEILRSDIEIEEKPTKSEPVEIKAEGLSWERLDNGHLIYRCLGEKMDGVFTIFPCDYKEEQFVVSIYLSGIDPIYRDGFSSEVEARDWVTRNYENEMISIFHLELMRVMVLLERRSGNFEDYQSGLVSLIGSDKQVRWAREIRNKLIQDYERFIPECREMYIDVMDMILRHRSSGYWINRREYCFDDYIAEIREHNQKRIRREEIEESRSPKKQIERKAAR